MPRPRLLDVNTISRPLRTLTALRLPSDGGKATLVGVELVTIKDEDGNTAPFPDGRPFWGAPGMCRAYALIFALDLGPISGEYYIASTDVLSCLPLNEHLLQRSPGLYGDALVFRWAGWELADVPKVLVEGYMLQSVLDQVVAV